MNEWLVLIALAVVGGLVGTLIYWVGYFGILRGQERRRTHQTQEKPCPGKPSSKDSSSGFLFWS